MNNYSAICCQEREKALNKISAQGISVVNGISEWIKWTKNKSICQNCESFRADSLNMMDKSATESDKDVYLKKYFAVK